MTIPFFQVDAFTGELFRGNPAGVCPLQSWPSDEVMQRIAMENNLSETAFFVQEGDKFQLRWFTPTVEVELCGHATLASAHVLFRHLGYEKDSIVFSSQSGDLIVRKENGGYSLDFPADDPEPIDPPRILIDSLEAKSDMVYLGKHDFLVVLGSELEVAKLNPNFRLMANLDIRGVIVTAEGDECDFVSRFFAPMTGIDEDPVTGSAHTVLTPFWATELHKEEFHAKQLSERGGDMHCTLKGDRVLISGSAVTYLTGTIELPE
jgi:PhzF family phenazine biosynthesis protein